MSYYNEGFAAYLNGDSKAHVLRRAHAMGDERHEFTKGYFEARDLDAATRPQMSPAEMHASGRTRAGNDIAGL